MLPETILGSPQLGSTHTLGPAVGPCSKQEVCALWSLENEVEPASIGNVCDSHMVLGWMFIFSPKHSPVWFVVFFEHAAGSGD